MIDKNKNFVLKIELGIFFEEIVFKYINNVFPEIYVSLFVFGMFAKS